MRRLAWLIVGLVVLMGVVRPVEAQPQVERISELPAGDAAYGAAVGPDGLLYVTDTGGLRSGTILVYRTSGTLDSRITIPAGPSGSVALRGLAFDHSGDLYVADMGNGQAGRGRVVRISSRGHQSVFASDLTAPVGLAFDRSDVLYVTDALNGAVLWIGPDNASALFVDDERLKGSRSGGLGASGLAFSPNEGALYVSNPADDRILRVSINPDGSAGRVSVLADGAALRNAGRGYGTLDGPEGLAVDGRGNLLVAVSKSSEIELFSPEGRLLSRVPGSGTSPFSWPTSVALSARYAYVASLAADYGLSNLSRFLLSDLDQD